MESIGWLEKFLHEYKGVLIVISHDRHFLNTVTTNIADIDFETIITYTGNYDDMVLAKSQIRSRVESENDDKAKKVAQLKDFIARFGAGTGGQGFPPAEGGGGVVVIFLACARVAGAVAQGALDEGGGDDVRVR